MSVHGVRGWWWLALVGSTVWAADTYTRFIEAEDCRLQGLQEADNPGQDYRADRFVYTYVKKVPHAPIGLTKLLETDLSPGSYRVLLRVFPDGAPRSRQFVVGLNGASAAVQFPLDAQGGGLRWVAASVRTTRAGFGLRPHGGRHRRARPQVWQALLARAA